MDINLSKEIRLLKQLEFPVAVITNASLNPNKAYISIPTRPPVNAEIKAASEQKITEAWQIFQDYGLTTEILTGFEGTDAGFTGNAQKDILNMSAVHPIREDTITEILKRDYANLNILNNLLDKGLIKQLEYNGNKYFIRSYQN